MLKQFIFNLLFLLCITAVAGQEFHENNFAYYSTAEGMTHNTITGIAQDNTGYIWIATPHGLNRFDGSRFTQYHSNNDSISLAAEELGEMTWLDKDRLAVFTSGVHIVNCKTGETRNLYIPYHDKRYQFKFNMIERAMGDDKGNIYILTRTGFYHYDKAYTLVSRFDFYADEKVPVSHLFFGRGLFELDNRRMMIVSLGGLFIYDKITMQVKKMTAEDCPIMAEFLNYPEVSYLFLQPKPGSFFVMKYEGDSLVHINIAENKKIVSILPFNTIKTEFAWRTRMVAVSDTVFYLTGQNSGFYKMRLYPGSGKVQLHPEKYFPSYVCTGLLKDKDNNLWVATNRGLFRQNPQKSQVETALLPATVKDMFPNILIDDIYVAEKKIYAGARGEGGLLLYDKQTLQLEKQFVFQQNNKNINHIRAITAVNKSTLLLGTNGPLLLFNMEHEKEKQLIPPEWNKDRYWTSDLFKDHKNNIWIGAAKIYYYNPGTNNFLIIPTHPQLLSTPFLIEEDRNNNIWMAGHGLARYNTVLNQFDLFLDSFPFIKMPDKQVNAMLIDDQNTVWFNSNNNGLIAYQVDKGTYRHFTRSNGLPDNNIASMMIIGNKLWMACYSGIACMDLTSLHIISFGKDDGFPDMPVTKGARFSYDSLQKELYIGFSSAIVRFNPDGLLQKKSAPHVFIETVTINEQRNYFLPGKSITTPWDQNEIMITIGSINFSDSYSQQFAYRIVKDSNTHWQLLGNQPSFSISNLGPGSYTIQVKAFSLNNRWPEQVKEIRIVVLPPFWQREWFIALSAALLLVLVYLIVKWRTGVARKKEMEKTHIQKLKADDYKNQFELEQISNYFSSSLAEKTTEDEVLWDVAGNLIARMNYVDCMIYLWNEDKTKMIQKAAYGPKGKPEIISSQVFDVLPGQGVVGHVMETLQPVLINDTRIDERYRVDEAFRLSEICVPIIHNDELMGIIDSEHDLPGYFSERDIKILTTIATLIGNKLKQIESERSLEAKRKELAGINEQLAETKLSALQAQMNPHFVFNALNSIKRMILDNENENASRYLSKFAMMIRMTLNHSKDTFVMLHENIAYLKAYLEMEQLRFDDSFSWNIFTDENTDIEEIVIPSLMIQPLVENAIWHGLMQSEGEKKINISFTQQDNRITCSIEDNGIGILRSAKLKQQNHSQHRSVGLENLRNRIKIINEKYAVECRLQITDLSEKGTGKNGTLAVLGFDILNK